MGIEYKINSGQLVRIKLNNTPIMTGICNNNSIRKYINRIECDYTINSFKSALAKASQLVYANKGYSYSSLAALLLKPEMGFLLGYLNSSETVSEFFLNEGKTIAQTFDLYAKNAGISWWVDTDLDLNFCDNEGTISAAPYNIDQIFGTNFEDYRNVIVNEDYSQYYNSVENYGSEYEGVFLHGMRYDWESHMDLINICGYYAWANQIISDNNIYFEPDENKTDTGTLSDPSTDYYISKVVDDYSNPSSKPDIEIGDFVINRSKQFANFGFITTISMNSTTSTRFTATFDCDASDYIWYNRQLNDVLKNEVNSKSAYPPALITFDTYTPGFLPRQRMYINLPDNEVEGYFLINQVQIKDLECNKFEFTVSGEKKNYSNWITKSDKGYVSFFKNF
jgi:hypothetical protein